MQITIRRLTSDMAEDYLWYFDTAAFTDHDEWSACYCLESPLSKEENESLTEKSLRRERAKQLIESGIMQGYLLYDGSKPVGWCNAGDKSGYEPLMTNADYHTPASCGETIKSVYCFEIAPGYRGKGIAHLLLTRIIDDARKEGCSCVEGYPFSDRTLEYQFHGPIRLYEAHGFRMIAEKGRFCIMQKKLI